MNDSFMSIHRHPGYHQGRIVIDSMSDSDSAIVVGFKVWVALLCSDGVEPNFANMIAGSTV